LLRVLYAYYNSAGGFSGDVNFGTTDAGSRITGPDGIQIPDPQAKLLEIVDADTSHKIHRSPGEDYFFIDLASDLFNQPTGLAIYFKDQNATAVGAMYLEDNYVQGHQMTISSGSVLIMEGVSMQYDRLVPIKVL
jgi:hypothetical protein